MLWECNIGLKPSHGHTSLFAKYMYNLDCLCAPLHFACARCCFSLFLQYEAMFILLYRNKFEARLWTQPIVLYFDLLFLIEKSKFEESQCEYSLLYSRLAIIRYKINRITVFTPSTDFGSIEKQTETVQSKFIKE